LVKHATLRSPVANTLHNPVHVDVTLASDVPEAISPTVTPTTA
jgi:hypothetical protein